MNKFIIVVIVLVVIAFVWMNNDNTPKEVTKETSVENVASDTTPSNELSATSTTEEVTINVDAPVKEFAMDSFVEFVDEKPKPQFSVKEITVNKGDLVRLKVTVTKGTHDFKIDEFNVFSETPTDETTTIEFVADKTGEFIYYCNQPNHRKLGHWGTLKVLDVEPSA